MSADPQTAAPFDVDVHAIPANARFPRHLHHDVRHAFLASRDALTPGSDVKTARWVSLADLTSLNEEPSIQRIARKLSTLAASRGEP